MFIAPMDRISSLDEISKLGQNPAISAAAAGGVPFQSLFTEALSNVKEANQAVQVETQRLATGQASNPEDLTIASTKLSLSTELFIQIRNKALDAYNEVMRMGV